MIIIFLQTCDGLFIEEPALRQSFAQGPLIGERVETFHLCHRDPVVDVEVDGEGGEEEEEEDGHEIIGDMLTLPYRS